MADDSRGTRDLVVIGASAGGVETLRRIVGDLPEDLAAAVCIVLHIAPGSPSALASILRRAGRLPCQAARDGDELRAGQILVAPPDHHLVIEDGRVRLTVGPRENGHRPAVDTLFRSAAEQRDGRVIGVVLSGTRDDGTAGLAVIKANGGATIVQDPEEALYAGMPASALAHVAVDAVVPSARVAEVVTAMVNGPPRPQSPSSGPTGAVRRNPGDGSPSSGGVTTVCPECGGVLTERSEAGMIQWECRVGHRYSQESLADAQAEGVESGLWAAVRALEDRVKLLQRMAAQAEDAGRSRSARSFRRRAESAGDQAQLVREALTSAAASTLQEVAAGELDSERESAA